MAKHPVSLMQSRSLFVVKKSDFSRMSEGFKKNAVVGWEDEIKLLALDDKKMSRAAAKIEKNKNSNDLVSFIAEWNFSRVIVQDGVPLDIEYLTDQGITIRLVSSAMTLLQVITGELKDRNLHWLGRAMNEWSKSSIPAASPEVMVQQFAELGYPQIGKQLLKSLRVVTEAELRAAFKTSDAEQLGLHVVHAYVHDGEAGSSSLAVKNVLEHLYPSDEVVKIDVENLADIASIEADIVYVYEDGLWSGVELVRRLNTICGTTHFKTSDIQLHFKYGVTSDAGLVAARLFAKRERIGRVQFRAATLENHFTFLKTGTDTCLLHLTDRSDDEIRKALDAEIEPFAFRSAAGWDHERSSAISVCSNIGEQLIRPFLERNAKEKFAARKDKEVGSAPVPISDAKVARWGLGALGFASTIVFSSSIPKPVLPLFWLNGTVCLDGKTVQWRPLFWDVRRIGHADKS